MTTTDFDKFAWHRSLQGADLTDGEHRVLTTLWDYAAPDGENVRPGHAALATACRTTERTVRRHIASLLAKGWLYEVSKGRNVGRGGGAARYRLTTPRTADNSDRSSEARPTGTPDNPDQNSGQSTSELRTIHVGTPDSTDRLTDQEQKKRTDQGTEKNYSSPLETHVALNLGSAGENENTEHGGQAADFGREPTPEELQEIEADTDEWNSMAGTFQEDPFGIEAEDEQRRLDEENEYNRKRIEQTERLVQMIQEQEMAR